MTTSPITRHRDQPLIVAVVGLCYSGKSSLIAHLAPLASAAAIAEYSALARHANAFLTTIGGTPAPSWRTLAHHLACRELRGAA